MEEIMEEFKKIPSRCPMCNVKLIRRWPGGGFCANCHAEVDLKGVIIAKEVKEVKEVKIKTVNKDLLLIDRYVEMLHSNIEDNSGPESAIATAKLLIAKAALLDYLQVWHVDGEE